MTHINSFETAGAPFLVLILVGTEKIAYENKTQFHIEKRKVNFENKVRYIKSLDSYSFNTFSIVRVFIYHLHIKY